MLELDHRELGTLACPVGPSGQLGLLLFDDVAGGAGHVVELAVVAGEWLKRALDVMRRGVEHDRSCVTACLECLLTASSQVDMEAGRLQRRATRDVLIDLLSGRTETATSSSSGNGIRSLPSTTTSRAGIPIHISATPSFIPGSRTSTFG